MVSFIPLAVALQAVMVSAMPANVVSQPLKPASTVVTDGKTSYLYALPQSLPASLASELAALQGVPTGAADGVPNTASKTVDSFTRTMTVEPVTFSPVPETPDIVSPSANFTDGSPGYRSVGYYGDWYVYARNFTPQKIISDQFTHLVIAFSDIMPSGEVFQVDTVQNYEKIYENNPSKEQGATHGILEVLWKLKNENRNVKFMLGIGGWTYSEKKHFQMGCDTPEKRLVFAQSIARLVNDMGLDGADIDWEYITNPDEATMMVDMLKLTRQELDKLATTLGSERKFELSVAVSVDPVKIGNMNVVEMDKYLDFWNIMGYDYSGSWSTMTQHAANMFPATDGSTAFSTVAGIEGYMALGVSPRKLTLGLPVFAHGFMGTDGFGKPFQHVGEGSYNGDMGFYEYRLLPRGPGYELYEDEKLYSAYIQNKNTRELYSFDTPKITKLKVEYMIQRGLGGVMFWGLSGDIWTQDENLIETAVRVMGRENFAKANNHVQYPTSKWANIRKYDGIPMTPDHPIFDHRKQNSQ
ncbi:hypothetical protein H072_1382 [Dactylellina haptotyla CBS 200.50]|uniref:chitinase n=1 Tax=Dactylellina haptotyla (strain CBS 200.50) TaxID=1284197 RepID=S8BYR9_DACHA|nr:hypothetical protein H072_1382 [Dactylellina haptotyla CBS 200.50]